MGRLDGKVAIITGAARGQGAAEARLFAAEGARVLLGDVLDAEGKALAAELGSRALYTPLDVTDESAWRTAVELAEQRFGPVHVLVNNAGIVRVAPLELGPLGIRVNSIHPGGVDTPMVRGIGVEPDAGAASYSTGSEFIADGGLTAGFRLEQYVGR